MDLPSQGCGARSVDAAIIVQAESREERAKRELQDAQNALSAEVMSFPSKHASAICAKQGPGQCRVYCILNIIICKAAILTTAHMLNIMECQDRSLAGKRGGAAACKD